MDFSKPVKVEKDLVDRVRRDYQQGMSPRRVCYFLRQAGFTTRQSGGISVVDVTLPLLARACVRAGIDDEMVRAEVAKEKKL